MPTTLQNAKQRYKINKSSITLLSISLIVSAISLLLMNTMANIASFWSLEKSEGPLPDYSFELFEIKKLKALVDVFMNTFIIVTALCILLRRDALAIYFRSMTCMNISYFVRMTTVSITNLPTPNLNCRKIVNNMFTTFTYDRCGDLMFSGHSLVVMMCAMVWSTYNLLLDKRLSRLGCISAWAVSLTIFMFILITRNHYTIDVLISVYVTGTIWVIYGFIWEKYLSKEDIFKSLIIEY